MASPATSSSLRERRLQAGLTQAELATRAGVSRQLVAAVEAGQNAPAVDAAMRLARALATTVEDLFAATASPVVPAVDERLRDNVPLRVGRVGDRIVAAELPDHGTAGATWARSDGALIDGTLRLFGGACPDGLVLAGCEPALGIAEAALHGLGPCSLVALAAPTDAALRSLDRGSLHGAVVHGPEQELPRAPVPVIRIHLARWQVGVATPPKLAERSLQALLHRGVRVAQRDPAAASQQALDRAIARAGVSTPAGPRAAGHLDAARIAAMLECAAVTTESAARAFDLHFLPLEEHAVQIWLDRRWTDHPAVDTLGSLLTTRAFRDRVEQFGGYDLTDCGIRVS
jgi:DNA-binding XRE family transcriptional regulator